MRRGPTIGLGLLGVLALGLAIGPTLEVWKLRSARRAWEARVAPHRDLDLETRLPPPPVAHSLDPADGGQRLVEAQARHEARWADVEEEARPSWRYDPRRWAHDGLSDEERAELTREMAARLPELEPVWKEIVAASRAEAFFGTPGARRVPDAESPGWSVLVPLFCERQLRLAAEAGPAWRALAIETALRLAERWPHRVDPSTGDVDRIRWTWYSSTLLPFALVRVVADAFQRGLEDGRVPDGRPASAWARELEDAERGLVERLLVLPDLVLAGEIRTVPRVVDDEKALRTAWERWREDEGDGAKTPYGRTRARTAAYRTSLARVTWAEAQNELRRDGAAWTKWLEQTGKMPSRFHPTLGGVDAYRLRSARDAVARLRLARLALAVTAQKSEGLPPSRDAQALAARFAWVQALNPLTGTPFRIRVEPDRVLLFLDLPWSRYRHGPDQAAMHEDGELWILPR